MAAALFITACTSEKPRKNRRSHSISGQFVSREGSTIPVEVFAGAVAMGNAEIAGLPESLQVLKRYKTDGRTALNPMKLPCLLEMMEDRRVVNLVLQQV